MVYLVVQDYKIEEVCFGCICEGASGCNLTASCTNQKCGPFQLPKRFWIDSGEPTVNNMPAYLENSGELCLKNPYCTTQSIRQYFAKNKQVNGRRFIGIFSIL